MGKRIATFAARVKA